MDTGDMWRSFFARLAPPAKPLGPHWCSPEALALSLGRIRVLGRPGPLHPMALTPSVVRL